MAVFLFSALAGSVELLVALCILALFFNLFATVACMDKDAWNEEFLKRNLIEASTTNKVLSAVLWACIWAVLVGSGLTGLVVLSVFFRCLAAIFIRIP